MPEHGSKLLQLCLFQVPVQNKHHLEALYENKTNTYDYCEAPTLVRNHGNGDFLSSTGLVVSHKTLNLSDFIVSLTYLMNLIVLETGMQPNLNPPSSGPINGITINKFVTNSWKIQDERTLT